MADINPYPYSVTGADNLQYPPVPLITSSCSARSIPIPHIILPSNRHILPVNAPTAHIDPWRPSAGSSFPIKYNNRNQGEDIPVLEKE
jgi:hypothetical protein